MIKFASGKQVVAPQAKEFLQANKVSMFELVHRHYSCDWGIVEKDHLPLIERNLVNGQGPLFSIYKINEQAVFVSTNVDRSITAIFLPSELDVLLDADVTGGLEELVPMATAMDKGLAI